MAPRRSGSSTMDDALCEPMVYFQKFLASFVQETASLSMIRGNVSKLSQLAGQRPVPCCYVQKDKTLVIGAETGKLVVPLSSFESITWGEVSSGPRQVKFIQLQTRTEKAQVINLYSQNLELMELWYDGLRFFMEQPPETRTSLAKVETFTKAVEQANLLKLEAKDVEIPPLPWSLNYPPAPSGM